MRLGLAVALVSSALVSGAPLSVTLDAPWPTSNATALMLAAEFASRLHSNDAFWHVVQTRQLPTLSPPMQRLLQLHLDTNIHALALEQQRTLATALRSALDFADPSKCGNSTAFAAVQSSAGTYGVCAEKPNAVPATCSADTALLVTPSDHVHPASAGNAATVIIVHGELGTAAFTTLMDWAVAQLPDAKVLARLAVLSSPLGGAGGAGGSESVRLGGFGATLDVKSTEYVTVDLSSSEWKNKDAKNKDADVVQGVVFSALLARADVADDADKKKRLSSLHSALRNEQAKGLKPWQMRDLSTQVALDAMAAADPLQRLVDVVSNLPAHAERLSRIAVPEQVREQLESKPAGLGSAGAHLLLDGRILNGLLPSQFDLAGALRELGKRFALEALASALPVSREDFASAMAFQPRSAPSWGSRVDVRRMAKGAVVFFNDLEKDATYAQWSAKLDGLRTNPRSFQQVRRNVHTIILSLDPLTDEAEDAMRIVEYLVIHGAPVRFGAVFTSPALVEAHRGWKDDDAVQLPGEAPEACAAACVAQLVFLARKQHGGHAALAVAHGLVKSRQALTRSTAQSIYAGAVAELTGAWRSGPFVTEASTALNDEWLAAARMARYVGQLRLPLPCFTMNGAVHAGPPSRLDRKLSGLLMDEQLRLAAFLESGLLHDEGELLQQVLRSANAMPAHASASYVKTLALDAMPDEYCAVAGSKGDAARVSLWLPVSQGDCSGVTAALDLLARDPSSPVRFAVVAKSKAAASARFFADMRAACASGDAAAVAALAAACDVAESSGGGGGGGDAATTVPVQSATPSVVVNGREYAAPGALSVVDLVALVQDEDAARAQKAAHVADNADAVLKVAHAIGRFAEGEQPAVDYTAYPHFPVQPRATDAFPELTLLVDPLSASAPRVAQFALTVRDRLGLRVRLALAPDAFVSDLPAMSYYRFALDATEAVFKPADMAQHPLLTLKLSTAASWIAYPFSMGGRDPDNLVNVGAASAERAAEMTYRLTHVLVDGHATLASGEPAAGMQLRLLPANGLVPGAGPSRADTIVMHNLGYFQLKATPGAWFVESVPGSPFDTPRTLVVLDQFSSAEPTELRATKSASPDLRVRQHVPEKGETLHVFSLASGALYERFLRIMMLCVRRRTSGRLKFWLLENYMSPPMKRFIGPFAAKHGFDVELVTFKWPEWLRGQSERQRQIWGMKILFLDVLFPLDVHRVVYVDADQVVRSDLRELWTMDLRGAPYGFTPFCTSRQETLGFQFWRQGFWKNHLKGKNYHISALFVVDLDRFRAEAVGDQLRASYQSLSADPASLSNLDQDLPNFTQHQIPIFSLPEEWLWCESWCSDASKAKAKTLDLCNNPLFKEPKLDMARRIVSGDLFEESWDELDAQASEGFAQA